MKLSVYLYQRSNVDWRSITESNYLDQESSNRSVRSMSQDTMARMFEAIRIWNRTFSLDYFQYRQRLREIAWNTWMGILDLDGILCNRHQFDQLTIGANTIVVPVDEDDWFAPHLAQSFRANVSQPPAIYSWNDVAYRPVRMQNEFETPLSPLRLRNRVQEGEFATNGYAVNCNRTASLTRAERKQLLLHHTQVASLASNYKLEWQHSQDTMSVEHKSLASCTNMTWVFSSADLLRNVDDLGRERPVIDEPQGWMERPLKQTQELNHELTESVLSRHV